MFFKELYAYRYLLREIVAKNIKIQYRNSFLGMIWTLLDPLLTTLVLVFVFGFLLGRGGDPDYVVNFPIYLLCGRLLFHFYSQSTKKAMRSVRSSASVIKKVKVPKHVYPLSCTMSAYVSFLFSMVILVGFVIFFFLLKNPNYPPPKLTLYILMAPIPLLILFILSMGAGLILSTMSVFFKDVEYIYDVFCMLLFYTTPIIWTPEGRFASRPAMMAILNYNPLYCIIEMFRNSVLRGLPIDMYHFWYALGVSLGLLLIGILLFRSKQDKFILHI